MRSFSASVRRFWRGEEGATLVEYGLLVGLLSIALLVAWERSSWLKKLPVPGPLAAVLLGWGLQWLLRGGGEGWAIGVSHLVQVPAPDTWADFKGFLQFPDFAAITNPRIFLAAITIAIVASLETLLNLEAVDKLDPHRRISPTNRELIAQGTGNVVAGLIGALPVTSVISSAAA